MFFVGLVFVGIIIFLLVKPKQNSSESLIDVNVDRLGDIVGVYLRTGSKNRCLKAIESESKLPNLAEQYQIDFINFTIDNQINSKANYADFWNQPLILISHEADLITQLISSEKMAPEMQMEIYVLYIQKCVLYVHNTPSLHMNFNSPQSYNLESRMKK